jgi:hypothetical protein
VWCVCAASSLNISSGAFKLQTVNMIVLLYSTVQYSTVRYVTAQDDTVQWSTLQCSTSHRRYKALQYVTAQYGISVLLLLLSESSVQ